MGTNVQNFWIPEKLQIFRFQYFKRNKIPNKESIDVA